MKPLHSWDLSPAQAIALQNELLGQIELQPLQGEPKLVAGADLSFDIGSDTVYAGIVVLSFPELEVVEECGVQTEARFPYVPGLLSFREAPAILEVWKKLKCRPDVLVLDGQGTAHPRIRAALVSRVMWGCGCKFPPLAAPKRSCAANTEI